MPPENAGATCANCNFAAVVAGGEPRIYELVLRCPNCNFWQRFNGTWTGGGLGGLGGLGTIRATLVVLPEQSRRPAEVLEKLKDIIP